MRPEPTVRFGTIGVAAALDIQHRNSVWVPVVADYQQHMHGRMYNLDGEFCVFFFLLCVGC